MNYTHWSYTKAVIMCNKNQCGQFVFKAIAN